MSVIRTKHVSDTDKYIQHYTNPKSKTVNVRSLNNSNTVRHLGTLFNGHSFIPVPLKKHTEAIINDKVPPTGPTILNPQPDMTKTGRKRKAPGNSGRGHKKAAKRRKTTKKTTKKTAKKTTKKTGKTKKKRSKLPPDVI